MIFNPRSPIDPADQRRALDTACAIVGVPAPTAPYTEARDLIMSAPSVADVAREYASAAYTADKPAKLVTEATEAIKSAQAGEALRQAFLAAEPEAAKRIVPEMIDQGLEALRTEFDKDAARLARAARKLDQRNPLDAELAVAADAGKELTTARDVLARFNAYAQIVANHFPSNRAPMQLRSLLTIIELPKIVQEQVYPSPASEPQTANPKDIEGTLTVRELGSAAVTDVDATIIAIARGDYKGVSLNLTPRLEVPKAAEALTLAFNRRVVRD